MNALDVAFVVGCVLAIVGGWRMGFIRRVTGWIGLLIGVVVASRLLPVLFDTPSHPHPGDLLRSLAFITAGGIGGQAVGHFVGGRVRNLLDVPHLGTVDSGAGGVLGIVGIVLAAWMIIPAMVQIPGWPADAARSSVIAGRLTRYLGKPPDILAGVADSLGVDGLSDALENIRDANVRPVAPVDSPIPAELLDRVRRSVVKVSGPACDRLQSGSGFVIAPGMVATNAHVVAGDESIRVTNDDGLDVAGSVRYLDIHNDIALVAAPDLDRPVLELGESPKGGKGAILGYPNGGPLVVQPYDIASETTATSRDIYEHGQFERNILVLGSKIGPGDSGGPLVDPTGRVAGIAFGIAPDDDQTAYAVPSASLRGILDKAAPQAIDSGACRVS